MIQITAGTLKSKRFSFKSSDGLRPTSSKIRMALFNMLGESILQTEGLDVFAGTGIIGLEAISRGAKKVTFFELDRSRFMELQFLAKAWEIEAQTSFFCGDALKMIEKFPLENFDWIYVDPPYGGELLKKTLHRVLEHPLIKMGGYLIIEFYKGDLGEVEEDLARFYDLIKHKRYGKSELQIYRRMK